MKMAFLIAPQVKHVPPALTWSGLFTLTGPSEAAATRLPWLGSVYSLGFVLGHLPGNGRLWGANPIGKRLGNLPTAAHHTSSGLSLFSNAGYGLQGLTCARHALCL